MGLALNPNMDPILTPAKIQRNSENMENTDPHQ
jgi:hypothetical protein